MLSEVPPVPGQEIEAEVSAKPVKERRVKPWVYDLLLIYILLGGAYFRLVGIRWGEYQYLHPDERFLIWVGTDITPKKCLNPALTIESCPPDQQTWIGWKEYFDSANSTLNPVNRGHGFYVYGTLPMFMTRYLVEWFYGHSGFNEMTNVGRPLSALMDLLTVLLVFLIAEHQYDRRVGLLAAAFAASAVLMIQQSHFFTMDTFVNFFTTLAIYFALRLATEKWGAADFEAESGEARRSFWSGLTQFTRSPFFRLSIVFGVALGCAVASKLNAAPVAILLPAALALTFSPLRAEERRRWWLHALAYLVLAAVVSLVVFRLFQPYAFSGPGFFGLKPNPQWVANIREQRIQAGGDVDFPPALQWARRPVWFSGQNLVLWGLGLPLGLLAWAGFLWVGWRILKGEWKEHILLWGWVGCYFVWQSLAFNPTMRYQLPIYPSLTIFAAWAVFALLDRGKRADAPRESGNRWARIAAWLLGASVLLATLAWAFAFTRIYVRPITRVAAARWIYQNIPGPVNLKIQTENTLVNQPVPVAYGFTITTEQPYFTTFSAQATGQVTAIYLGHAVDVSGAAGGKTLLVSVGREGEGGSQGRLTAEFGIQQDARGKDYWIELDRPVPVVKNQTYPLSLTLIAGSGQIVLSGAATANESSWDDGLPLRIDGYDGYGGIYQPGLNFEMYWDDNPEKLERFYTTLDQADYIFITSNRQWGSLPRLPERYPLSIVYYRSLLGCPTERAIEWCYAVAVPGRFQGELGFELVQVFQSNPSIGAFEINDQFAEEAFTVYDHPKVLIFRKTEAYDPQRVRAIFGAVDLSKVVHLTPKRASARPATLTLPAERWAEQQAGGTWSELFDTGSLINRYPFIGVVVWYLALFFLGVTVFPLLHIALPGLADAGYPLARVAGLLLLSYLVWIAGSFRLPFTRLTISLALLLLLAGCALLAYRQRTDLYQFWQSRRRHLLTVELLFLAFFIFDLLIRLGNPDLWHPWKGGEKPMDFAYFNAVLKSTSFPPYDPWYAGGYLNYYYYGFVLVGVLVKWLGIVPAVAYNLIIPSIFAMIAMGAFSLGWNLLHKSDETNRHAGLQFWAGLAAALGMAVLGNLGTVRMIYQGYQRLAAPGGVIEGAGLLTRWVWALRGAVIAFTQSPLPYSLGDWYWIPSRAIPAPGDVEPITEFPFFTVLYADPHAHLFALPITLLVLAFALSVVLSRGRWQGWLATVLGFLVGALSIGALRPTNTWDIVTYLPLGCVAVAYALLVEPRPRQAGWRFLQALPDANRRGLLAAAGVAALILLSIWLYQPYANWYGQGYNRVDLWKGTHTTLTAYLTHWGLFLFVIIAWMVWETRDWLASTPLSALRKLQPLRYWIYTALALLVFMVAGFIILGASIAWFVLPLAAWAGILILRPGMPDGKRFLLFLVGTALTLTLMVEVVVLVGDIGRMNTVFKFYLQAWTLLAISAAGALGWSILSLPTWLPRWRLAWQGGVTALVAGAAMFTVLGGLAKVKDRMAPLAPHTLDGMAFMNYAEYPEAWGVMDLSQDYRAIRWMQENVIGSPVIVEANLRDLYRWGSRFSIYTGLPGVVGWEWHQQQQRALLPPNWVSDRIAEIEIFYTTQDLKVARDFLRKYEVKYIILGQQERGKYPGLGLEKFPAANGVLWKEVYRDGETVIYEVLPEGISGG